MSNEILIGYLVLPLIHYSILHYKYVLWTSQTMYWYRQIVNRYSIAGDYILLTKPNE